MSRAHPETRTVKSTIDPSKSYQYIDDGQPKRGGMKDVFFSPDRKYVVAFYRSDQDYTSRERLRKIVTTYHDKFFNGKAGPVYEKLYSWPCDIVEDGSRLGIIVPFFDSNFFFDKGYAKTNALKGREKEGKWFASARFRAKTSPMRLDTSELGSWLSYFQVCVNIARGVKRMHAAGLAHSDLSYKNVLVDPLSQRAMIIDIDGLVVPGLFPPDVIGTADFIAPEVIASKHLNKTDPKRILPSRTTDLHALATLIYMYLFYRHPLRGGRYFGPLEAQEEEDRLMGTDPLFVEHPTRNDNRNFKREYGDKLNRYKPWTDLKQTPYTIAGPYLKGLFEAAFIDGLTNPSVRPTADAWEQALIRTNDMKLKCANTSCKQGWFIYDNSAQTTCPFCKTAYGQSIPVFDLYYQAKPDTWRPDSMRLVAYDGMTLHRWHASRKVVRNEHLSDAMKARVGYISFHNGKWLVVNEALPTMRDVTDGIDIKSGSAVELTPGRKILFSREDGGRLAILSLANGPS